MSREILIDEFINHAKKYIGTTFKHQGRDKHGMDCIGIVVIPLNEIGFFKYDNKNYKRYGLGGDIKEILLKYCDEIDWPCILEKGDILLFSKGKSQHLAVYTGKSIVHANNLIGKVVEHDLDDKWNNLITKVYRYRER